MPHSVFDPRVPQPFVFRANGDISLLPVAAAPGTVDFDAVFDGLQEVRSGLTIGRVSFQRLRAGASGTTTVEVFRRRSGANTLIAGISILFTVGDYATASVVPAPAANQELEVGDFLLCQLTAVEAATAKDVTVQVELAA